MHYYAVLCTIMHYYALLCTFVHQAAGVEKNNQRTEEGFRQLRPQESSDTNELVEHVEVLVGHQSV